MYEIQQALNTILKQYALLNCTEVSKDGGMIDFDDFYGMYDRGLEISGMDVSSYGVEIGLLSHYEDELYYVNADKWQELHDSLIHWMQLVGYIKY